MEGYNIATILTVNRPVVLLHILFFKLTAAIINTQSAAGTMNGPFRATQRWNSIIKHLQDSVDTKPHKNKAKRYEGCFTGANAVDVLLPYLQQSGFERDISRENAVKLCQLCAVESLQRACFQSLKTKSYFG